jgi:HEAT repeat protein
VRELHWIGDRHAVSALGKLLANEQLCNDAARALIAIGHGAAEQFRQALWGATGKRRLMLMQSLGAVRDTESVQTLQKALKDEDPDVRLTAAWGLARIGDIGSVDPLLKAADVEATWERIKLTQSCLMMAENLTAAGKRDVASKIYNYLRQTRTDAREQYIRDIATKALAGGLT